MRSYCGFVIAVVFWVNMPMKVRPQELWVRPPSASVRAAESLVEARGEGLCLRVRGT